MSSQLQALAFPAAEGVDWLAELEIAEADFLQQRQAGPGAESGFGRGKRGEEVDDFVDGRVEEVGDGCWMLDARWMLWS